jgi:hypothetical protein
MHLELLNMFILQTNGHQTTTGSGRTRRDERSEEEISDDEPAKPEAVKKAAVKKDSSSGEEESSDEEESSNEEEEPKTAKKNVSYLVLNYSVYAFYVVVARLNSNFLQANVGMIDAPSVKAVSALLLNLNFYS